MAGLGRSDLLLSLLGAMMISGLINQPLARLTAATRGAMSPTDSTLLRCPKRGPTEIREANHSSNQMVDDLNRVESDRAVVLAGISHDLRTPLARMQLEVELAGFSDDARQGMQSDLEQMDDIIGQFLDYAKPIDSTHFLPVDMTALITHAAHETARLPDVRVTSTIDDNAAVLGSAHRYQTRHQQSDQKTHVATARAASAELKVDIDRRCRTEGDNGDCGSCRSRCRRARRGNRQIIAPIHPYGYAKARTSQWRRPGTLANCRSHRQATWWKIATIQSRWRRIDRAK